MEELREKLHKAIENYGIGDERTIDISISSSFSLIFINIRPPFC